MATEEKKTPVKEPVKVTSGRDFVAAKPEEVTAIDEIPAEIRDAEAQAAMEAKLKEMEKEFQKKKAEMEKLEADFAAKLEANRGVEVNHAVEGEGNVRGRPIPVEAQEKRPRHISEIDPAYNGKEDSLRELRK